MWRGIRSVRPGARLGDIGARDPDLRRGPTLLVVREYCGHGIGRVFHEDPQVLHYGEPGTGDRARCRHDLHDRADGQRRQAPREAAAATAGPWSPRTIRCRRSGNTRCSSRRRRLRGADARRGRARCGLSSGVDRRRHRGEPAPPVAAPPWLLARALGRLDAPIASRRFAPRSRGRPASSRERFRADESVEALVRDRARDSSTLILRDAWRRMPRGRARLVALRRGRRLRPRRAASAAPTSTS